MTYLLGGALVAASGVNLYSVASSTQKAVERLKTHVKFNSNEKFGALIGRIFLVVSEALHVLSALFLVQALAIGGISLLLGATFAEGMTDAASMAVAAFLTTYATNSFMKFGIYLSCNL